MYHCHNGLFVGVDHYARLPKEERLSAAHADASALGGYFRTAKHDGVWDVLIDGSLNQPTRAEILERLHRLATGVPQTQSGIFYFAGNACASDRGLILMPTDHRPGIPYDTGIPLGRILAILKASAATDARFLLILDCCRDGNNNALADDIPPQVAVIYSTKAAEFALENNTHGFFSARLLKGLACASGTNRGASPTCTARQLFDEIVGCGSQDMPVRAVPALHGSCGEDIRLPLVPVVTAVSQEAGLLGTCKLTTYRVRNVAGIARELRSEAAALFGLPLGGQAAKAVARDHVVVDREHRSVSMAFPLILGLVKLRSFVEHLLERFPSSFETMNLEWHHAVPSELFRQLTSRRANTRWQRVPTLARLHTLSWSCRQGTIDYYGEAWIDSSISSQTSILWRCRNPEGNPVPLYHLGGTLGELFVLMWYVANVGVKHNVYD